MVIIAIAILIGTNILSLIVLMEFRAHSHAKKGKLLPQKPLEATLPAETLSKLENDTKLAFEAAVARASQKFDQDLDSTSQKLNQLIVRLTTEVVEKELVDYRAGLTEARSSALESLRNMQSVVDQEQSKLRDDMQSEVGKRQAYLVERLDRRLGEIATNYIAESLGQGVDLGAQKAFLLASLERNKDVLKKDILGDA